MHDNSHYYGTKVYEIIVYIAHQPRRLTKKERKTLLLSHGHTILHNNKQGQAHNKTTYNRTLDTQPRELGRYVRDVRVVIGSSVNITDM